MVERRGKRRDRWMAAACSLPLALLCGCETMGSGRSFAGGSYAGATPRVDARAEAARSATRLDELEAAVRRLQAQVDSLSDSQQHVLSQAEARVVQARQESQSVQADVETLKRELAMSKAEQQQLRSAVDDLPARVSRAIAAARPATPAPQRSSKPAASSGSGVGYEHVVEAGQTLSEIAQAYGVRTDAIVRENQLKDAGAIRVGQKLFIPKP